MVGGGLSEVFFRGIHLYDYQYLAKPQRWNNLAYMCLTLPSI